MRTCLDRLDAAGIISPCDPGIAAGRINRAGRRPQGGDLNLGIVCDDLTEAGIMTPERQFPGLAVRPAIMARPDLTIRPTGQPPHPTPGTGEPAG